jgi:hypothetical protein
MHKFLEKEQYNPKTTANIAAIYELCVIIADPTTTIIDYDTTK